jgi:hypothetical protein
LYTFPDQKQYDAIEAGAPTLLSEGTTAMPDTFKDLDYSKLDAFFVDRTQFATILGPVSASNILTIRTSEPDTQSGYIQRLKDSTDVFDVQNSTSPAPSTALPGSF